MKTTALAILLSFAGMASFAQSCKFNYDKVDPFTNEREQRIVFAPAMNQYFSMAFYHKGTDYRVESNVNMPGKQEFEIPVGSKLDIKLGNGKVLSLENAAKATPAAFVGSDQVMTSYAMSYTITKEQFEEIAANGPLCAPGCMKNNITTMNIRRPKWRRPKPALLVL